MSHSVYIETSIVDLKPRMLEFIRKMTKMAVGTTDFIITAKKKEMAEAIGKDVRTVSRYLKELEEKNVIHIRGRKGRAGGTIIMFNTDLIKFSTSDKALVNSDPDTIDKALEVKLPKKEKKPSKRNRRTKQQMIEDKVLKNKKNIHINEMNDKAKQLGGVPNWDWFQQTENPVEDYRTYLLSRIYNRYAVLFTDKHNAEVEVYGTGKKVKKLTNTYDVLPEEFYGSSRWQQFDKFKNFCQTNNINPAVYLSAQFNRSVFTISIKGGNKILPFTNALTSDASYEVYLQYVDFQKQVSSSYKSLKRIPIQFADDFVIKALVDAYNTADKSTGMLSLKTAISDFIEGEGSTETEDALLGFYRMTDKAMKEKGVSLESRNTIKKYLMLESLVLTGGIKRLPMHVILSREITRAILVGISGSEMDEEKAFERKSYALGMLLYPHLSPEEQVEKGSNHVYQFNVLTETPQVLKLIMERKNLHVSVRSIQEAFKEYGKDKIPVDDYSVLDVNQVVTFMEENTEKKEQPEDVDLEAITIKRDWELLGEPTEFIEIDKAIEDYFK